MRYNRSAAVSDEGIAAVSVIVSRRFRWIFREIAKRDIGIDAQVEVCDGDRSTSRLLALQIKSGDSYFRERGTDYIVFRDTEEHLEYFLAHSLPVLIILYDPRAEQAWWELVREANVRRTSEGWAMRVPLCQEVAGAAADWSDIAAAISPGERKGLPRLKPWYRTGADLATIHEILHTPRRSLDFITLDMSREFVAILEFLATKITVRGVIGNARRADDITAMLPHASRMEVRLRDEGHGSLHLKALLIDDAVLCVSSSDLSWAAMLLEVEVMNCTTERRRLRAYRDDFRALWERGYAIPRR